MSTPTPFQSRSEYNQAVTRATTAALAYYEGDGDVVLDDLTYDVLVRRIAATETQHPEWGTSDITSQVAAGVSRGGDVDHSAPMLSLDNAMDDEELSAWYRRLTSACGPDVALAVEVKIDGLALAARYVDGKLVQVLTRGDGSSAEDVTDRANGIKGIPTVLTKPVTIEVRGECYFTEADFIVANEHRLQERKAPFVAKRQAAAGTIRRQGGYRGPLSFAAYAVAGDNDGKSHGDAMAELKSLGFVTAASLVEATSSVVAGINEAIAVVEAIADLRDSLDFGIDGVVIKANLATDRALVGTTSKAPRWAIARKLEPNTRITKLLDIKLQIGRTGALTPVGVLDPIFMGNSTIEFVTLNNAAVIAAKDLRIGDDVVLQMAGDVIPEVIGRASDGPHGDDTEPWQMPDSCPTCGEELDATTSVIVRCLTPSCSLIPSLTYFAKRECMDIEGLGEALITGLVDAGLVAEPADFYKLTVTDIAGVEGSGTKIATKIVANIEKSKSQPLNRVFCSLGLRMTGRSVSRWLARRFGSLEAIRSASVAEIAEIEKLGNIKASAIVAQLKLHSERIDHLVEAGVTTVETSPPSAATSDSPLPLRGLTVVVSGSVPGLKRNEAQEWVERLGGTASGSVSNATDLLVVGDKAGTKADKAAELGVKIMPAEEFASLVASASI